MDDSFESVSPENNDQEQNEGIDTDNRSDSRGSTLSSSPDEYEVNESENVYKDEDDDDEYTWDENSSTSEDEQMDIDEDPWYPLPKNYLRELPNFGDPIKTPSAFSTKTTSRNETDKTEDETKSEKDDEEYQNALDMIHPDPSVLDLKKMVLDFFIWNGYVEPIEPFCREMGLEIPHEELRLMHARIGVKNMIIEGNLEEAINKMCEICPTLLEDNEELSFAVRRHHVIEMIRQGQTEEPFDYARKYLMKNSSKLKPEYLEILEKTFALMAYELTDTSPFHYQYEQSERDRLARDVNSAILGKLGKRKYSKIETLTKLITWTRSETPYPPPLDAPQTSQQWAKQSFEKPNNLDDFISLALAKQPLDLTTELG